MLRNASLCDSHNFPHPGRIACCSTPNSRPPATKALHTICGNNTSIVSRSWWWAYECPKHIEQIIIAIKHSVASSWFSSLRLSIYVILARTSDFKWFGYVLDTIVKHTWRYGLQIYTSLVKAVYLYIKFHVTAHAWGLFIFFTDIINRFTAPIWTKYTRQVRSMGQKKRAHKIVIKPWEIYTHTHIYMWIYTYIYIYIYT